MAGDWTCHWMRDCVQYVIDELNRQGLVQPWVPASAVWEGILAPCQACRSTTKRPNHRKCRGWRLVFSGHQALIFRPTTMRKRTLQVSLEGCFDVQRPHTPRAPWEQAPMRECSAVLRLIDPASGKLLTRQHLDLANDGQSGTAWHLQLGGVGSTDDKEWRRVVAAARWPSGPIDFMLFVELALFLFHWDSWTDLRTRPAWRSYVQVTEDLVLPHYVDVLRGYLNQRTSQTSWLAKQCNIIGSLKPRPQ